MRRSRHSRRSVSRFLVRYSICLLLTAMNSGIGIAQRTSDDTARYDIIIAGGRIVDGTGAPWYVADIGIRKGRIAKIGRISLCLANQVINARGLIVAPGFIDMMGQTATPMLRDPSTALNLLLQGITTINAGEGASAAPVSQQESNSLGWQSMSDYFQLLDLKGLPVNVAQTVGHTQIRRLVMGVDERRPSADELVQMKTLVEEAMQAGAIGISTALIYPPAVYANTEELAALAAVAGRYGGRYYTHMRNEGDQLLEAIDEALEIGRLGRTPVHIFHLKAAGTRNWGKMQLAIARIKAARAAGHQVTADIYPYINNGLGIDAFIHPRHFGQGRNKLIGRLEDEKLRAEIREEMETTTGWENWFRHVEYDWGKVVIGQSGERRYRDQLGQSVAEIAKAHDEDPWDTFFNLVQSGSFALPQSMTDANKLLAMQQEFVSFCTDVGPAGGSRSASHPRAFGAFPRLLSRYVRDLGAISLERAVAQTSAAAANNLMAYDRGRIAEGLAADLIVFDYQTFTDKATFAKPREPSVGMQHVLVNGQLVLHNGKLTGGRPGIVLRGPGYDPEKAPSAVATGETFEAFAGVDQVMQQFVQEYRIPGVALAITDHGRLAYVRGFGYADVAERELVRPDSLFRIASISKPLTSVAILQLVDRGSLKLDDKVVDILGIEPHLSNGAELDERQKDIEIVHLLQHRGGWDRDKSFDAMFRSVEFAKTLGVAPPANANAVIRVMLGKPLDFDPGLRYAYSNYGYCLLGRVIEKVSGQSYEAYVKQHVLAPLGIRSMQLGSTLPEGRADGEVRYYDPRVGKSVFDGTLNSLVPQAYGAWNIEAMDSHGGWIASAIDLARFASAFDIAGTCPILSEATVPMMFLRPEGLAGFDAKGKPKSNYYGLGWSIAIDKAGRLTAFHGGSLPGTNTRMTRRPDGRNVVILFNTRLSYGVSRVVNAVWPDLQDAIDGIPTWPEHDLFERH